MGQQVERGAREMTRAVLRGGELIRQMVADENTPEHLREQARELVKDYPTVADVMEGLTLSEDIARFRTLVEYGKGFGEGGGTST